MRLVKSVIFLLLGFYTLHNPVIWGIIFFPRLIASIGKYEENKKKNNLYYTTTTQAMIA